MRFQMVLRRKGAQPEIRLERAARVTAGSRGKERTAAAPGDLEAESRRLLGRRTEGNGRQ